MKRLWVSVLILAGAALSSSDLAAAQVPMGTAFGHRGQLIDNGVRVDDVCDFEFTLWNAFAGPNQVGPALRFDGLGGNPPPIPVRGGLYRAKLDFGAVFDGEARWLQIASRCPHDPNDTQPFATLTPRKPLMPIPYALYAETAGGAITGSGTAGRIPKFTGTGTLGDSAIYDSAGQIGVGTTDPTARLHVNKPFGSPADPALRVTTVDPDNLLVSRHLLFDGLSIDATTSTASLPPVEDGPARLHLNANSPGDVVLVEGGGKVDVGGTISLDPDDENSGGKITLNNGEERTTVRLDAGVSKFGGATMTLYDPTGKDTIRLSADVFEQPMLRLKNSVADTVLIRGGDEGEDEGGVMTLQAHDGTITMELEANESGTEGAAIKLYNAAGDKTIELDADVGGDGRVVTQELQITGGSDLSEKFNVNSAAGSAEPGTVVCIDPRNAGRLVVSRRAYDRTVAGVVSGAGGVKPGMLMAQEGSVADGEHPVALSGRVYVWADASSGPIRPGDLLTTSDRPGDAMKVSDHVRAQGAVLGKAMSPLEAGRGLVLALVSLQ